MPEEDDPSVPRDRFGLIGVVLAAKYRVDRVVAEGGFAIVYAGRALDADRAIAIKVLKPTFGVDHDAWLDFIAQFDAEARALSKLRTAAVVQIVDSGLHQFEGGTTEIPWMILEWLDGQTLREELDARPSGAGRSPIECMALLRPVLEAIAEAHEHGIVHRDIKPGNVMLVPMGDAIVSRVFDFGVAKLMGHGGAAPPSGQTTTQTRVSSYTIAYAAPEQLSASRTGPWTDVYALGLIITETLIGRPPLPLDGPHAHFRAVFSSERPTPAKHGVDVGAWEPVLARALAIHPGERQPDARTLLAELDAARVAAPRRTPAPVRSDRTLTGAIVAVVALLAVIIAIVAYRASH